MTQIFVIEGVNPEPWTPGTIGVNPKTKKRFMYKDSKLTAFQKALAGELKEKYPGTKLIEGDFTLDIWFWRSTEQGNQADRTNLQKATEDALQGILFANDRPSRSGHTEIVEQAPDVESKIIIQLRPHVPVPPPDAKAPTRLAIERTEENARRATYNPSEDF